MVSCHAIKENGSWDGDAAKKSLFEWATDPETGELQPKKLKPYFGKVTGDGKSRGDYSFPLARVVDGKPEYDREGLIAAFKAARGAHGWGTSPTVAAKVVRIFKKVFGEDELTEGMKELDQKRNSSYGLVIPGAQQAGGIRPPLSVEVSWDDAGAKAGLLEWARGEDGRIQKKLLMKWFLDIDGGEGQDPRNYRYPVGRVSPLTGEPEYDPVGIDHSWDLASGKKTGVANRAIQRKIIFLKKREGFPLTPEQLEFIQRHMASGETVKKYRSDHRAASVIRSGGEFYVDVDSDIKLNAVDEAAAHHMAYEFVRSGNILNDCIKLDSSGVIADDNSPGGFMVLDDMKYNSVTRYGSKVIRETDEYIDIPVIPMREGVFTGTDGIPTFKPYEVIKRDAHWLEGQPILRGHTLPTEIVTYKHDRIGKLLNVRPRDDRRDVIAVARYFKSKITPEELERIRSGVPYDGSIAYTCKTVMKDGEFNGEKYNAVETEGYHFYHFAEVPEGACSVDKGCGFNLNEKYNGDVMVKKNEKKIDETEIEDEEFVTDEDGNECLKDELVDGKCPMVDDEDFEFEDEDFKENASITVDVNIPDEFVQKLTALTSEMEELKALLTELVNIKSNAAVEDDFAAFKMQLNAAARKDAEAHYAGFQEKGWQYFRENPGILKANVAGQVPFGTPVSQNSSYNDELAAAKEELRKTLRSRITR